jgi:hypothetical protein
MPVSLLALDAAVLDSLALRAEKSTWLVAESALWSSVEGGHNDDGGADELR